MNMTSILIVEDEAVVAADLASKLHDLGYSVVGPVRTGETAVVVARERRPALVLVDAQLAGTMNGITTSRRIQQACDVPVVIMTCHPDRRALDEVEAAEALGYVLKPCANRELRSQIEMAFYRHATLRRIRESEARFAGIVESAMDAIITTGEEQLIVLFNKTAERMFQCPAAEALGTTIDRFIPERFRAAHQRGMHAFWQGGQTRHPMGVRMSVTGLRADGTEFPIEASVSALEVGGKRLLTAILRDMTERTQGEEELKRSVSRLKGTLDCTTDGLLIVDLAGRITTFNQQFAEMWRLPERILDRGDDDQAIAFVLEQLEDAESFLAATRRLYAAPEERSFDVLSFKDGRVFERYSQPQQIDGQPVGRVWSFRDITARTQAENALRDREARFRAMFDQTIVGVSEADVDGHYLFLNDQRCRQLGYSREELLQMRIQDVTHPEDSKQEWALFSALKHGGADFAFEKRCMRKDGSTAWFHNHVNAIRDPSGKVRSVFAISVETTERKLSEEALARLNATLEHQVAERTETLRRSEANLNEAQEIARLGNFEIDIETSRVTWSDEVYRIFGFDPAEGVTIEKYRQAMDPAHFERVMNAIKHAIHSGDPFTVEHPINLASGETREIFCIGRPTLEPERGVRTIFGTVQDITERKLAERARTELNQKLIDASRHAGMAEVATGVLHNVGNVLNSVNISTTLLLERIRQSRHSPVGEYGRLLAENRGRLAEFLSEDPRGRLFPEIMLALAEHLDTEQADCLQELESLAQSVGHLKQIVAMQQSYASLAGASETVTAAELVEDALRLEIVMLDKRKVQVHRIYEAVPYVTLDRHKVVQILVNLIRNAAHALAARNEDERQLILGITASGEDHVAVRVEDNGEGIPPEDLGKIFSFGHTTRPDGHGFGLHHGANAAKEMGGDLSVESAGVGLGATFTLRLRLAAS